MDYSVINEIKQAIQKDVLENDKRLFVDICRLLECALNSLITEEKLPMETLSLMDKANAIAETVSFDETPLLREIIKKRNQVVHEGSTDTVTFIRKIELCRTYNRFIEFIKKKYKNFSYRYKIDEDIFDVDLAVKTEEKYLPSRPECALLKSDITRIRSELDKIKDKNSIEYVEKQIRLHNYEDSYLPYKILEVKSGKRIDLQGQNVEFSYSVGVNNSDYGFNILGIKSEICKSKNRSLYAILHGILSKGRIYKPSSFLKEKLASASILYNLKYIIRYQFLILSLLKNNVFSECLTANVVDGTEDEFVLAFEDIQYYLTALAKLQKIDLFLPKYCIDDSGITLSVRVAQAQYYTVDKSEAKENSTFLWTERAVKYTIDEQNEAVLSQLAADIFQIEKLKDGQIAAIKRIFNKNQNAMCLMPTGYGKSLIFYFISYLNPGVSVVLFPTDALIQDQIRNLNDRHFITNVATLEKEFVYGQAFELSNKLVYVKPDIFLNKTFLSYMANLANEGVVNYAILDEVHCLSIWSHDFRPDYIMLASYFKEYLTDARVIGFTATASIKVLVDLKERLSIQSDNVIEDKNLKRSDITLKLINVNTLQDVYRRTAEYLEDVLVKRSRSLVFVKNEESRDSLFEALPEKTKSEIDTCLTFKKDTFTAFAKEQRNVLVTSHDLGIGINLPNVNSCIHVGYPVSINQFVQEVGRIAREDNLDGNAVVVSQDLDTISELEKEIIDPYTSIEEIIEAVRSEKRGDSDIIDLFKSIFDYLEGSGETIKKVNKIWQELKEIHRDGIIYFYPVTSEKEKKMIQFYLIILTKIGVLKEWFYEIEQDNVVAYRIQKSELSALSDYKDHTEESMRELGADSKAFSVMKSADSVEDIIIKYILWYYNQYLGNQREQVINVISAVFDQELEEYFGLDFEGLEERRAELSGWEIKDFLTKKPLFYDKKWLASVKRLCEIDQEAKYDLFLLWSKGVKEGGDFLSRLNRAADSLGDSFIEENFKLFDRLYENCNTVHRKEIIEILLESVSVEKIVKEFFADIEKDENYCRLLLNIINVQMEA